MTERRPSLDEAGTRDLAGPAPLRSRVDRSAEYHARKQERPGAIRLLAPNGTHLGWAYADRWGNVHEVMRLEDIGEKVGTA